MNPWHLPVLAEYHRQDLERELIQIHREEQFDARPYRPRWFASTMFNLAEWMIGAGKQLRRRYEAPVKGCSNQPTESYAR